MVASLEDCSYLLLIFCCACCMFTNAIALALSSIYNICWVWYSAGAQEIGHVVPSRLAPFVGEEVTIHNTGISLLLSTSVWFLLRPTIERR